MIEGLEDAVAATMKPGVVKVKPVRLTCLGEAHVDCEGSLVLRAEDGQFVICPRETWKDLRKIMAFAEKRR